MNLDLKRTKALSLPLSVVLVVVLATVAYVAGTVLARRWATPSLALRAETPSPQPETLSGASTEAIDTSQPVEGVLDTEGADAWTFLAQAGQDATLEMWFHPGSGSSIDAELLVRLTAPNGSTVAEQQGSIFLPPYLFQSSLPASGTYLVLVTPVSGAPGRYSLRLTLSDGREAGSAPGTDPSPTPAAETSTSSDSPRFEWPSARRSISGWTFHDPANPGHIGLDIAAETWDPIVASADGEVVFAEWGGGYGNLVILEHAGGWSSYYAHLTEIAVNVGQQVRQGETLGGAGTTGYSTGPHLHFELRDRGRPVDPHVHLP